MPSDERDFECVIERHILKERFSATVRVKKRMPIRRSLKSGKIDLADVFIWPISCQPTFKVHHHFVVYDFTGGGCLL